jgi:NitT/TauT family transport system ATP-binding protein
MKPLILIHELQLFIDSKQLFSSFNLSLKPTERVGITGPSGCGKTTLIRGIIQGQLPVRSNYKIFNVPKTGISYVPQTGGLIPWFTLKRNLIFFFSKTNDKFLDKNLIEDIVKGYGLDNCLETFPANLSGGEYQRAVLACATVTQPKIFLIDEPLTEVDTRMKWIALETLTKAVTKNSAALLLVSHDIEILTYLCDKVIMLGNEPVLIIQKHILPGRHPRDRLDLMEGDLMKAREKLLKSLLVNKA